MSVIGVLLSMIGVVILFIYFMLACSPVYRNAVLRHIEGKKPKTDYGTYDDDGYKVRNSRDVMNAEEIAELERVLNTL